MAEHRVYIAGVIGSNPIPSTKNMKNEQLKNRIKGAVLKEKYLEAFLAQSAYIESLVKLYVDYNLFDLYNIDQPYDENKKKINKMIDILRKKFEKYNLYDLIEFLSESELLSPEERQQFDKYREKRNKILHDLLMEIIKKENFENELKNTCELGEKIINSQKFIIMSKAADRLESLMSKKINTEAQKQLSSLVNETISQENK